MRHSERQSSISRSHSVVPENCRNYQAATPDRDHEHGRSRSNSQTRIQLDEDGDVDFVAQFNNKKVALKTMKLELTAVVSFCFIISRVRQHEHSKRHEKMITFVHKYKAYREIKESFPSVSLR